VCKLNNILRLFVAAVAGLVAFFPLFFLFSLLSGSNDIGAVVALGLGILGVPIAVLRVWRRSEADAGMSTGASKRSNKT
jgi:hypothetical protein